MIRYLIRPQCVAIDGGAHKGIYSFVLAKHCREVHAFEPNPIMYRYLRKAVPKGVICHEAALGDVDDTVATLALPIDGGRFQHTRGSLVEQGANEVVSLDVRVRAIDGLGVSEVGYIKLDIEGAELAALKGAQVTIERDRPVIQLEATGIGGTSPDDLYQFLKPFDYVPATFTKRYLRVQELPKEIVNNCLFLPRQ